MLSHSFLYRKTASNLALTLGPNIEYVLVKTFNPYTHIPINIVLAKALLHKYFRAEEEDGDFENYSADSKKLPWKILTTFKGSKIEECSYEQLLAYDANQETYGNSFRVICGDFLPTL